MLPESRGQLEAGSSEADMAVVMWDMKPAEKAPGASVLEET